MSYRVPPADSLAEAIYDSLTLQRERNRELQERLDKRAEQVDNLTLLLNEASRRAAQTLADRLDAECYGAILAILNAEPSKLQEAAARVSLYQSAKDDPNATLEEVDKLFDLAVASAREVATPTYKRLRAHEQRTAVRTALGFPRSN